MAEWGGGDKSAGGRDLGIVANAGRRREGGIRVDVLDAATGEVVLSNLHGCPNNGSFRLRLGADRVKEQLLLPPAEGGAWPHEVRLGFYARAGDLLEWTEVAEGKLKKLPGGSPAFLLCCSAGTADEAVAAARTRLAANKPPAKAKRGGGGADSGKAKKAKQD